MRYLKADTAATVRIGPAVAIGDGYTCTAALAISTADYAYISDAGGTETDISANTWAAVTSVTGWYDLTLTAGQLGVEGPFSVMIYDVSLCLPIWCHFHVVNANVYDSLFAAATTDYLQVDTIQWIGTAAATPTTAGVPEVELARISGQTVTAAGAVTINAEVGASATAMDAFEDQYDGTGLTGDTYPATQQQIGQLAVGAGGISTISTTAVVTTGTETLTYAATEELDGITHDIAASGGNTEFYYQFDVGSLGVATEIVWEGYAQSQGDSYIVNMYDWVSASFKQVGTLQGANGATITEHVYIPTVNMTGSGANDGLVRVQFTSTTGTEIFTDRILCEYAQVVDGLATTAELAKVPKSDGAVTWNATALASINAEADTAISDAALATAANLATVDSIVDAILVDTGTTLPATLGTPTGADMSTDIAAIKTDSAAILVDTGTTLPALIDDLAIKKNTAFSNFEFLMVLTSDHVTPATGLTVTGQRSIDGAAFASVSGTIAEVSNGIYQFDALAADTNGDVITWRFSSATADDAFMTFKTVA